MKHLPLTVEIVGNHIGCAHCGHDFGSSAVPQDPHAALQRGMQLGRDIHRHVCTAKRGGA